MPEHIYERADLIERFDRILGRTLEEIDDKGLFQQVRAFGRQKGVVGTLIEQCVLGYAPDSRQEADLVVLEGAERTKTELKSTGMVIDREPTPHFVAKEPMSITAVGDLRPAGAALRDLPLLEQAGAHAAGILPL